MNVEDQSGKNRPHLPLYTIGEEIANSVSHGIAALLSLAGLIGLVVLAFLSGNRWHVIGVFVYGITLFSLYLASTLYHGVQNQRLKRIFQRLDHSAIYLLIAGTYTPFLLIHHRDPFGWLLLAVIWGLALLGIGFKAVFMDHFHRVSVLGYMLMGWLGAIVGRQLFAGIPISSLYWLAAGGFLYTAGVIFLAVRRIPYNHAIWHGFVIAASICHFIAVYNLLPNT
jgi:hemolysin III